MAGGVVMRWLALPCLLSGQAWATDWYVCPDTQGEYGLEDGTSLANCFDGNADIGWASINAGDTLYFCGDWLPADARITVADSGSAGNYITLSGLASACGRTSNSTISREGLTGASSRAIAASNTAATRQYIRIEDMTIQHTGTAILWDYSTTGAVSDDTSLWVRRVTFTDVGNASGTDGDGIWKRGEGLIVEDSTFDDCYEDCIWTRAKNVRVENNRFTNISSGGELGDATQIDLTGVSDSGYSIWRGNYCDHTDADNKYCFVEGPTAGSGSSVTVTNNTALCPLVPTNPTPANQCHPIYIDTAAATAVEISRNFTQGGEVGISLTAASAAAFTTRAKIIGNVVYKASDRGIWTDANVDNIDVWNNSVSEAGQEALYIGKSGAALNANNNLLANSATGLFFITEPTSRGYNAYRGNTTNVDMNGTPGSTTTGDLTSDPRLAGGDAPDSVMGFCLAPDSPLLSAGTYLGAWATGYAGHDLGKPPAIGARGLCRDRQPAAERPSAW